MDCRWRLAGSNESLAYWIKKLPAIRELWRRATRLFVVVGLAWLSMNQEGVMKSDTGNKA